MRRSIGFIARSRSKAESPPVRGGLQRVQGRQAWMESRITVIRFIWLNQDLSGYFSPKKPIIAGEAWFRIRQIIRNGSAEHPRDCRAEILRRPEKRRLGHRKKRFSFSRLYPGFVQIRRAALEHASHGDYLRRDRAPRPLSPRASRGSTPRLRCARSSAR